MNTYTPLPDFTPTLEGFRADEFLALSETLLAFPLEHDQAALDAAPFRLERPEARPEAPLPSLPPRWYPHPAPAVLEAARAALTPPPRPPIFEGRVQLVTRVLRPLLAGETVRVQGEAGVGKSALLAWIANHERTRQRFRRIWWIDEPARLEQTLALVLGLPQALAEPDAVKRRAWLAERLDDHTLLIVDNLTADDPLLDVLPTLSEHVLLAIETVPTPLDPDEPLPEDPHGVVTLRGLDDTAAVDALAAHANIADTRRLRGQLLRLATALGHHPYALMLAGRMVRHDGLTLDALEELLALETDAETEQATAPGAPAEAPPELPSLNRALDVSLAALPRDYRRLFDAFAAFPSTGAPFEGLCHVARLPNPLSARRGLRMLAAYGFVTRDHRAPDRYIAHPMAYARALSAEGTPATPSKRAKAARTWALRYARAHADDPLALYRAQSALLAAWQDARRHGEREAAPLEEALRPYLAEYVVGYARVRPEPPAPLSGPRQEAAHLTQYGLELTDQGAYHAAEEALTRALALRREHDSAHAVAESEVALARLYDQVGRHAEALDLLLKAAEHVYALGAEASLSVARRGLARVYRHLGRLAEALEVLDDAPEAHAERALILRAQGHYTAAVEELALAEGSTPYDRAEILLLAGRYEDVLDALEGQTDAASLQLRAQAYHLLGRAEDAIRCTRRALELLDEGAETPQDRRARVHALRGLGAALAYAALNGQGDFAAAQKALQAALTLCRQAATPDPAQVGGVLRLLAAVHLAAGDPQTAAQLAQDALAQLRLAEASAETADAYRTLGRALWRLRDYAGALEAFQGEVEHAQSVPERDEMRIGVALHHLADAYRMTEQPDRAIANYRLALTHKDPAADPFSYLITQLALHETLLEVGRVVHALDLSQEIVDHLARQPEPDLAQYGYAQAVRARTQKLAQRPIRARQSLSEWARTLTARRDEAVADPRPALRTLALGLAVRSLLAEGRPALAQALAEANVAEAAEHFPNTPAHWAAMRDLGEAYLALDRPADALEALEPLLAAALRERSEHAASVAHAYTLAARAYRKLGDAENALAHLRIAAEHEPVPHLQGVLHEEIAAVLLDEGQPTEAVEALRAALPLLDREQHPEALARALTMLAHTLGGLNRYAEAIGVYEEALAALRDVSGTPPTHTAEVLRSLGQTHEAQGQLPEAARAYRRALNVLERAPEAPPDQVRDLLHTLARVTAQMGDHSAIALYEQVRELTREWGDARELGIVLRELGDVHRQAEHYTLAVQNYQAALESLPVPPFVRERIETLRSLGRAYAQMERYDEAREVWQEALTLSAELPEQSPQELALTHHAIAEAYRQQGHYADAERSYQEALRHHPAGTPARAETWRALGAALLAANRPAEAANALAEALEIEKAQPQQVNARIVRTLQALAQAHEAEGALEQAVARHHEALVYMDRRLQPAAYAETLRTLGRLYREAGKFAEAHTALQEALTLESEHAPRSDARVSATLQAIADTYRAQGDLEQAAEYYQKVTVYANMSRRASAALRETLDELDRRRETLRAAQQSLQLLDRSDNATLKDRAFVYALIAYAHAQLNQPERSADAIRALLHTLEAQAHQLSTEHPNGDERALAWLLAAHQAERQGDMAAAEFACGAALEAVRNANLQWLIEQVMHTLQSDEISYNEE